MNYFSKTKLFLTAIGVTCLSLQLSAQDVTIEQTIGEAREKPIPVSISGFTGEAADVIKFDLYVQGFCFTNEAAAQFQFNGSNNGNLAGRVTDRFNKSTLLTKSYTGATLRVQAHTFVDEFLAAIGRKGIGQTKITFKVDTGPNSEVYIADFDGHGAQSVTVGDNTIVAAPTWAPGKMVLYYTSYKLGNPYIFRHDLSSGQRVPIARYSSLNTSPAVSPDGSKVAMILGKSGSPDVYVCNADGSGLKQLTATREDESSPCWSSDGQWICFAGKKDERRSLWKVPAAGGAPQRISTAGVSNPTEPDWSPDGKWIVFTSMYRGGFSICVVPAAGGKADVLLEGEDPSWAPNSRTVVYARRGSGGRRLSLLDVPTKQTKDISRISGSNSQPSWAK